MRAVIEVMDQPEREGGFDRLAARISQFDAVESCYLMSGSYDLPLCEGTICAKSLLCLGAPASAGRRIVNGHTLYAACLQRAVGHLLLSPTESGEKPAVSP